jgi:hypothetical protein
MQPDVRSSTPARNRRTEIQVEAPTRFIGAFSFLSMRKLFLIVPFFLVMSCRPVQAPLPPTPAPLDGLSCRPDVIAAMTQAWEETGNGETGTEAGFRMDVDRNSLTVVPHEHTNEQGSLTTVVTIFTTAEFHVHPLGSGGAPSTPENNVLGDSNHGDTKVADDTMIDVYTFNNEGLFVYRWDTKQTIKLRDGFDWQKPCPKQ